jgi:hypothetical protein
VFDRLITMTEDTMSTPMLVLFYKIVFGEDHTSTKIQTKDYSLKWYFYLPNFLVMIKALYMESIENFPFSCRFHQKISVTSVNWTKFKCTSKVVQAARPRPIKSLLSVIFGRGDFVTIAIESLL